MIAPGPSRTEPVCPVFGSCGGCSWQHLDYTAQLEAKREILRDALTRIGKLASLPEQLEMRASPAAFGYRTRARILVERDGVGFRQRRSHDLCATSRCPILVPVLDATLETLGSDSGLVPGEWQLAAGDAGEISLLAPDGRSLGVEKIRRWFQSRLGKRSA